jgi:SAM-dependent methyltransferase
MTSPATRRSTWTSLWSHVPEGEFRLGQLQRLPVGDAEVDLVVCGLALTHVADLKPVIAEFARVLRPSRSPTTLDHLAVWTAAFGFESDILEPPELIEHVRILAARLGRAAGHTGYPT